MWRFPKNSTSARLAINTSSPQCLLRPRCVLHFCLCRWIEELRYNLRLPKSHSFANLFKEVDDDGSGFITVDELREVVRHKLKVKPSKISENDIKALWCALDADESDQVHMNEFSAFLKGKRPAAKPEMVRGVSRASTEKQLPAGTTVPTAQMKAELEKAGVSLPDDEQLTVLSTNFNELLEELRYNLKLPKSHSFANLFKEVDKDK